MATMTHADYVGFVEHSYFGSVIREDAAAVQACFIDDARITIYHGDNPIRSFHGRPAAGQRPLPAFYDHLWENFTVAFDNFRHIVDTEHGCCASIFTPTLIARPQSTYREYGALHLNNCNFFWFRDGRIADMTIYYANPTLGAILGVATTVPTGFPKS